MYKPGDKVRIKSSLELAEDDRWSFDPFMHIWRFADGSIMRHRMTNEIYTLSFVDDECAHFQEGVYCHCHISAIAEVITETEPKCTCGAAIAGALGHYQWCDIQSNPLSL